VGDGESCRWPASGRQRIRPMERLIRSPVPRPSGLVGSGGIPSVALRLRAALKLSANKPS
jgi:hypothetical protein